MDICSLVIRHEANSQTDSRLLHKFLINHFFDFLYKLLFNHIGFLYNLFLVILYFLYFLYFFTFV